jgi:hypothetical protein
LPETKLDPLLELQKELAMLGIIGHVDEDADQVVSIGFPFVTPVSPDRLRFTGDCTEPLFQPEQGLSDGLLAHVWGTST